MTADNFKQQFQQQIDAAVPVAFRSLLELATCTNQTTRTRARLLLAGSHGRLIDCARDARFSGADQAFFAALAERVAAGEFGRSTDEKQRKLRRTLKNTLRP